MELCPPTVRFVDHLNRRDVSDMIVIGADTPKRNHTLVALDGRTGAGAGSVRPRHLTRDRWRRYGSRRSSMRSGCGPVAFTDEHAMEIRVLSDYRDQIICERTRMINRLRRRPPGISELQHAGWFGALHARSRSRRERRRALIRADRTDRVTI
jgi:hypothetical protein